MSGASKHDAWQAGESYDAYMGRWSRKVAPVFLDRIGAADGLDWLDVGCGTGALSEAILARCNPRSLIGIDPSERLHRARRGNVRDPRASFMVGDAQALPVETGSRDLVVSALALNFVPDRKKALEEMARVARPGGQVAFYVWDYPGGGLEFLRAFWNAATALDPAAAHLTEDRRFPYCEPTALTGLATAAGLASVRCDAIEIATVFSDFDDYWAPLHPRRRSGSRLLRQPRRRSAPPPRDKLRADLPVRQDGTIALEARAWSIMAKAS